MGRGFEIVGNWWFAKCIWFMSHSGVIQHLWPHKGLIHPSPKTLMKAIRVGPSSWISTEKFHSGHPITHLWVSNCIIPQLRIRLVVCFWQNKIFSFISFFSRNHQTSALCSHAISWCKNYLMQVQSMCTRWKPGMPRFVSYDCCFVPGDILSPREVRGRCSQNCLCVAGICFGCHIYHSRFDNSCFNRQQFGWVIQRWMLFSVWKYFVLNFLFVYFWLANSHPHLSNACYLNTWKRWFIRG